MGYWQINDEQRQILQAHVTDRIVEDLGSGDGSLSVLAMDLGARSVLSIDGEDPIDPVYRHGVIPVRATFEAWTRAMLVTRSEHHVALVSWPQTCGDFSLNLLLRLFSKVIYLGRNDGGTACGSWLFWEHLMEREVLVHHSAANALTVYGAQNKVPRHFTSEERQVTAMQKQLQRIAGFLA